MLIDVFIRGSMVFFVPPKLTLRFLRFGSLFISKMMSTAKVSHIDSFEDLKGKIGLDMEALPSQCFSGANQKIIIRKGTFVENFFDTSEVGIISKIRGKGIASANFESSVQITNSVNSSLTSLKTNWSLEVGTKGTHCILNR